MTTLRERLAKIKKPSAGKTTHQRYPSDLVIGIIAAIAVLIMAAVASGDRIPQWEINVFLAVNRWPDFLFPIIWPFMQYGVFITIPVVATVAAYFKQYKLALMLLLGGVGIYFFALILKSVVDRGRPGDLLPDGVILREQFRAASFGFTSGHTAVAGTIATFAHRYLPKKWQFISIVTLVVVLLGRIYIGGHLPLDVLAGLGLGVATASILNFIVGVPTKKHPKTSLLTTLREELSVRHTYRHSGDVIRLILGATIFLVLTLLAFTGKISPLEEYLFRFVNNLPSALNPVINVIMQAGGLFFAFIAAGIALMNKQLRLAIKLAAGGSMVWWFTKLAKLLVNRDRPLFIFSGIISRVHTSGILGFPSGHAAVASLLATVAAPYLKKSWRRAAWVIVWLVALSRMYVGVHLPLDVFAGMALGWTVGSAINLAIGTKPWPLPRKAIEKTLNAAGLGLKKLARAHVDARGSTPMFAETLGGDKLFIKLINNEHRNADLLYKAWRYFTLREVEDEAPFATAKQLVEHEAYLSSMAANAGVQTPHVFLTTSVAHRAAVLVTRKVEGTGLDEYGGKISDSMLLSVWQQVKKLHEARIAHRDLRTANILIDHQHQPWIIDFSFSETAASERYLAADIVELLTSLSIKTDAEQAVKTAVAVLGTDTVRKSLAYIQPLALSPVTRRYVRGHPEVFSRLREVIERETNISHVTRVPLARFSYKWLVWLVIAALALYTLLPQIGELDNSLNGLNKLEVNWLIATLAASFMTYVVSAFILLGASITPLAFWRVFILQWATSFMNRITPKSAGGIAITERFLEKQGLSRAGSFATVSLAYFAGILVHSFMLIVVLFNTDIPEKFELRALTAGQAILVTLLGFSILTGIVLIPRAKSAIKAFLREGIIIIKQGFAHPVKLIEVLGGSAILTLLYTLALYFSLLGFDVRISFGSVLLVFLAGSALASASPAPSGLGATEAALVAGLSTQRVEIGIAIAAVLAFRLFTFWLPIVPGFFAFQYLRNRELL